MNDFYIYCLKYSLKFKIYRFYSNKVRFYILNFRENYRLKTKVW